MEVAGIEIKGVIFDMDGVLLFSNEKKEKAYNIAFDEYDLKGFDHTKIAGMRTDEVVRVIVAQNKDSVDETLVDEVTARKRELAKEYFAKDVPLLDGVDDLLGGLKKAGLKVALATSASSATMNSFLGALQEDYFDYKICGTEVEYSKPHPEIYERAINAISLSPSECLVVEDSLNGLIAGDRAGTKLCAVLGTIEKEKLEASPADVIYPNAKVLLEKI